MLLLLGGVLLLLLVLARMVTVTGLAIALPVRTLLSRRMVRLGHLLLLDLLLLLPSSIAVLVVLVMGLQNFLAELLLPLVNVGVQLVAVLAN